MNATWPLYASLVLVLAGLAAFAAAGESSRTRTRRRLLLASGACIMGAGISAPLAALTL